MKQVTHTAMLSGPDSERHKAQMKAQGERLHIQATELREIKNKQVEPGMFDVKKFKYWLTGNGHATL